MICNKRNDHIDRREYRKATDEIDMKPDYVCTSIENIANNISMRMNKLK